MSIDCLNEISSRLGTSVKHRHCGLFNNIRQGPMYMEDFVEVSRNLDNSTAFHLYYRVYNPSYLHSHDSPPLLVVHGGPSLPSDYLYPLAHQMPKTRSIIFYDQLGCGRSTKPSNEHLYSIQNSVKDLDTLISSLGLTKYHLLGHSFGGIVAYENIKTELARSFSESISCLSIILANAPCNMKISLEECCRLENEITNELAQDISRSPEESPQTKSIKELLRKRHECRTKVTPEPLVSAIEHRGKTSWSGPEAVRDYVAQPCSHSPSCSSAQSRNTIPNCLLIRGEFDFITEKCIMGWREIFDRGFKSKGQGYREEIMKNCSHYCHLEKEQAFAELVNSHLFINDY